VFTLKKKETSHHKKVQLRASLYKSADKSLARPGSKKATATEDFEFNVSHL
jgi:hypothetical protein